MTPRERIHVTPDKGNWNVEKEGAQKPSKTFDNKPGAIDYGKEQAKKAPLGQLIIHKKDGTFQEERTYKKDPYPPKG